MDGEETIPPEGGSSALRPFPYPIPYPLPIYSDHKGTDILSPSDRDPVTIPRGERPKIHPETGDGGEVTVTETPKGNETPETVPRWRIE